MMWHSFLFQPPPYAFCLDYIYVLFLFHSLSQTHPTHGLLCLDQAFHKFIIFSCRFSYQDDLANQSTIHYKVQGNLF
jgi:hypothetical protein